MTVAELPAVREALRRLLADALDAPPDERGCDEPLERDARHLCEQARHAGIPVEQLLVTLKDEWRVLPGVARLPYRDARIALSALVTCCIDEFYRDQPRGEIRPPAPRPLDRPRVERAAG